MNQPVPRKASATAKGSVADKRWWERTSERQVRACLRILTSNQRSTKGYSRRTRPQPAPERAGVAEEVDPCPDGGTGAHRLSARRVELKNRAGPERANSCLIAGMN